jgi:hypothetical protein
MTSVKRFFCAATPLPLFEIAFVLVRLDYVVSAILHEIRHMLSNEKEISHGSVRWQTQWT